MSMKNFGPEGSAMAADWENGGKPRPMPVLTFLRPGKLAALAVQAYLASRSACGGWARKVIVV